MTRETLELMAQIAMTILAAASLLPIRRIIGGPSLADRAAGLDTLLSNAVAMMALFAISERSSLYVPTILLVILFAFTGSTCFARYAESGSVFPPPRAKNQPRRTEEPRP